MFARLAVFICVLVLSTQPLCVEPVDLQVPIKPVIEIVAGNTRVFSGETIKLRCSVPETQTRSWTFHWFRGSEEIAGGADTLYVLARLKDSGKYYCKGWRETLVGGLETLMSLPLEINIDGGWAILQGPSQRSLVGENANVTCRTRHNRPPHEVILYKNGIEVKRGSGSHFQLTNLTPKDRGFYSCRASWTYDMRTYSVISVATKVEVLDLLSEPYMEIITNSDMILQNRMKLVCHVNYNVRDPAPPLSYYFYKNGKLLGPVASENRFLARRNPGSYSCKAKVPLLGLSRKSNTQHYGQAAGPQESDPPAVHPRGLQPLETPIPTMDFSLEPIKT